MKRATEFGFSLIELIAAMGVLLVIMAATMKALVDATSSSNSITSMAQVQDNLRAAMNLMSRDLIQTGSGLPPGGIPIPTPVNRPSPPGFAYTFPNSPTLTSLVTGASLGPTSIGVPTDMITVMYQDNTLPWPVTINSANPACGGTISPDGSTIAFDTTAAAVANQCLDATTAKDMFSANLAVRSGDLFLFSNANGSALQTVTNPDNPNLTFIAGDPFGFNVGAGAPIWKADSKGNMPTTIATRIWMITYYIDTTDPNDPKLMRQVNFKPAQAVAEEMENFQISYDIIAAVATAPANDAKQPIAPDTANQIRKANLYLAARSEKDFINTKQPYRTNLMTQVGFRSLSFLNQYQ